MSTRRSEFAKREYQKVVLSTGACGGAPPGLMNRTRTITHMMMRIPTSVAGSAMLELEALRADASGAEADCELLPADPFPGAVLGNGAFPELGASGVTLVGTVVGGPTAFCVPAAADWAESPADRDVEVWFAAAPCDGVVTGICLAATIGEAASPDDGGARAVGLWFTVPGVAGPAVGAFPDGEVTGADPTGDDGGVVDVWVGSVGDATGVGLGLVVPGVAGPAGGAPPDGEETGADATGDDVGVVDVWVGFIGDATGVGGPGGGTEVGCCGEMGGGVGTGG